MGETVIDLAKWERRSHYEMYRAVDFPHFSLTAPITVTGLLATTQAEKLSLFNAMLYCIIHAANNIPELRLRFREQTVLSHDVVHPSFTVPIEGGRFAFCQASYHDGWTDFDTACHSAIEAARQQTTLNIETAGEDHWIYLSCLPWLDFTAMTHPLQDKDDCIPRIAWGKVIEEEGRARVSINLQAHHAIMDGLHAARFFQMVQKNAESFQSSS